MTLPHAIVILSETKWSRRIVPRVCAPCQTSQRHTNGQPGPSTAQLRCSAQDDGGGRKFSSTNRELAHAVTRPFPSFSRVSDSPLVEGWRRSRRGVSAFQIPNSKFQLNSKSQNQNSKPTLKSQRAITRALTGLLQHPGAPRHPSMRGELLLTAAAGCHGQQGCFAVNDFTNNEVEL
jgi:hypothetical protein